MTDIIMSRKCPNPNCVNGQITINAEWGDPGPPTQVDCDICSGTGEVEVGRGDIDFSEVVDLMNSRLDDVNDRLKNLEDSVADIINKCKNILKQLKE